MGWKQDQLNLSEQRGHSSWSLKPAEKLTWASGDSSPFMVRIQFRWRSSWSFQPLFQHLVLKCVVSSGLFLFSESRSSSKATDKATAGGWRGGSGLQRAQWLSSSRSSTLEKRPINRSLRGWRRRTRPTAEAGKCEGNMKDSWKVWKQYGCTFLSFDFSKEVAFLVWMDKAVTHHGAASEAAPWCGFAKCFC